MLLTYMRVVTDPETACAEFNRIVAEAVSESNSDEDGPMYSEYDWMSLECVSDLRKALDENPYSEDWFIDEMKSFIMEQDFNDHAQHLVPIEEL